MQLVEIASGDWSTELCALAGIEPHQLSPIRPSGSVVGRITAEVSRLTGLPPEVVVVNGGHDQGCVALGLGVTLPGKILLGCGTAWVITGVAESPDIGALPDSLDLNFHVIPRRWTVSQSLGGLGASLEWLLRQCWLGFDAGSAHQPLPDGARQEAYAALDRELAGTSPGGNGLFFRPLTGGHDTPAGEQRGFLLGLRLDHNRADAARALMEGAGYELRWALDDIRRAGMPVERMWMIGGAAQSPQWPGILANVTGVPLSLPRYEHWPAVGAAILAGLGAGAFETLAQAQALFQRPMRQIEPDSGMLSTYDECFARYRELAG